jgi:hypothetical protein
MDGPPHEGMHQPDPAKMQAMVVKHLAALKAKLQITADQEAAWSSFSAAMMPPADLSQRPQWEEIQKLPAPERIDKMRALHSLHQVEMDKRGDAVKAFYVTLNPNQKKIFDAYHVRHDRKGGMHGMDKNKPPQ